MFNDDPELDLVILCFVHDEIIDASGGLKGTHDEGLVKSALGRPNQSAFGEDIYPDIFTKAAALLDSIANNHGFRDGNKRTAMAAAALFLSHNGITIQFTNPEYEEVMLHIVNHKPTLDEISTWLKTHSDT
jgi:death-on-curing protein